MVFFPVGPAGPPGVEPSKQTTLPDMESPSLPETPDFLVAFGGPVKLIELKEDEGLATIGGMLVRFTDPGRPDLTGDFFSKDTYLGPEADGRALDLFYQHGYDGVIKRRVIGTGRTEIVEAGVKDVDSGVWFEAQLALRDEYERAILELVKAGKVAYSSGAVGHLVERSNVGKSWHLDQWPLGEASLTPTPAEPLNMVSAKAYAKMVAPLEVEAPKEENTPNTTTIKLELEIPVKATVEAPEERSTEAAGSAALEATEPNDSETIQTTTKTMENQQQHPALETFTKEQMQAIVREAIGESVKAELPTAIEAANVIKSGRRGDDNDGTQAFCAYLKSRGLMSAGEYRKMAHDAIKASNDDYMNITTDVDGAHAVPEGHFQGIIARRDESRLSAALGVTLIPGKGSTVHVPLDGEDDGEFVSTAEAGASDRDMPALGNKAITLVRYTKKIEVTHELLEDEDSRLMAFLNGWVGRGLAKSHNSACVAEVGTNGTSLKTFASATAIAAGEIEDIEAGDDIGAYLDSPNVSWVMRNSTLAAIRKITANDRFYGSTAEGGPGVRSRRTLLEYPVFRSNKVAAIATGNKSVLFGDWSMVGLRDVSGLSFLLDPYSGHDNGKLVLRYSTRFAYGVLQAEAVGYAEQA